MVREHWRDPWFWLWLWRNRVSRELKAGMVACLLAALVTGGYFASGWLGGANAADGVGTYMLETTVTKVITVKRNGRTIVKRVPVVIRRSIIRSRTALSTVLERQVVTTPGGTRYVVRKVVHLVPVVRRRVVRIHGKTTTVTETHLVPTVKTETLTNVVTNQQTVTNASTVVVNHTETETVVRPVTSIETTTVSSPPQVVTVTVTQTETTTVVSTVTLPAETITETVTQG
jgi:hypothetical protein